MLKLDFVSPRPSSSDSDVSVSTMVEQIIESYQTRLYAYAYHLLRDHDEAEEVVQRTWITLWQHVCKYGWTWSTSLEVLKWLRFVLHNAAINHLIRESRLTSLEASDGSWLLQWTDSWIERPDIIVARNDANEELYTCVRGLPAQYKSVVALRFFAGLSLKEIAVVLDCPLGTVKCYLHRGLQALREVVEGKGITAGDLELWKEYGDFLVHPLPSEAMV